MKLAYHYHLKMLVENADEIAAFFAATSDKVGVLWIRATPARRAPITVR